MPSKKTGICTFCRAEIPKNSRSYMNHLQRCPEKPHPETGESERSRSLVLLVEAIYASEYWLLVRVKPAGTLEDLDDFLRRIWMECCGHMSAFSAERNEIPMTRKIGQVFTTRDTIEYEYDFGTTTAAKISRVGETEDFSGGTVQILIRNKAVEVPCEYCGENPAASICPYCINENEGGLLCSSCGRTHTCVQEEGEEILLPLVNSPRSGACGYTGYEEQDVRMYFPGEVLET